MVVAVTKPVQRLMSKERSDALTFEEVYHKHVDYLWRSARGLGISPSAVEDVLQDVFVVVHRRLGTFEGRSGLRTWLTRILLHVVQEHRRRFRRKEGHAALPEEVVDVEGPGPLEELARKEAAQLLSAILDEMQDEQRVVFVLNEIEQVPVPEIAQALELSPNTIYSRLRLARREYERHLVRLRARAAWRLS